MNRYLLLTFAAATLVLAAPAPRQAFAQDSTATAGFVTGVQEILGEMELPDGRTIRRLRLSLAVTADDPASPWHLGSQDCFATYIFAADGALEGGRGVCDFISPEGDVWWLTLEASGTDPVRWKGLGSGTGKLAGLDHSGSTVTQAEWGDGKFVGRWEGTMTRE